MKITLHKNQGTVFRSTSRFKVLAAGRRFGKTILACVLLFVNCLRVKDGLFWYISPTYKQTKQIAWKILLKLIPDEVLAKKPNETELSFVFKNGTELFLKGADNPDSLRGTGLDGLVIDEFASIRNARSVWQEVLRPALTDKLGWCFFIGTPKGKNAFWELWLKGQRKEDGFESWRFGTTDNPFISRSEIKEAKDSLNERYFRQEYEASFEDFTGLIWPEYSDDPKDKIVIDPFEIPDWWETVGCIDVAVSGTTAALLAAIDDAGTIHFVKEYYEQNKRASEVMDAIRHWNPGIWLIDPAAKIKNQRNALGELYTLYDEYSDSGIMPHPAENDVDAGINRFGEYLKAGKIKVFSTLKNYRSELILYHWAEERETVSGFARPVPYKSKDHLCDCGRYIVMSRPSEAKKEEEIVIGSMEHFEWMEKRQAERRGEIEE